MFDYGKQLANDAEKDAYYNEPTGLGESELSSIAESFRRKYGFYPPWYKANSASYDPDANKSSYDNRKWAEFTNQNKSTYNPSTNSMNTKSWNPDDGDAYSRNQVSLLKQGLINSIDEVLTADEYNQRTRDLATERNRRIHNS